MKKVFNQASAAISEFINDDEAATIVEYALLATLIAVAVYAATQFLGQSVADRFTDVGNRVSH